MKKTILAAGVIFGSLMAGSAMANDADTLKQEALKACEMQTQQIPEDLRAKQQENCQCTVDNTDYEALAEAKKAGDMAKVQQLKQEAEKACSGGF